MGVLLIFSVTFATGFSMDMVVALSEGTGTPILALLFLVAAPFPMIVCCQSATRGEMPEELEDAGDGRRNVSREVGLAAFGMLLTLGFGTLVIGLRSRALSVNGFLLALAGVCVTSVVSFTLAKCAMNGNRM